MTPTLVYEHTTDDEIEGDVIDGMDEMLGDDILSSDFDPTAEDWPGVPEIDLPQPYRA